ncbi:MAG: M20 family metallo-hydrolase [Chitinophagaceae bacterium]
MNNYSSQLLFENAVGLLKELISTPSFSTEEGQTAGIISRFLAEQGLATSRVGNNVFVSNLYFDHVKPTILLNSHHDTVKPSSQYTKDPYLPIIEDGRMYGLGSNDAGGALVSLIATFLFFNKQQNLRYNLALATTAEEEISGTNGIESILKFLPEIDCAIVGEPTQMQMAVAEKGLMVLDCIATGKPGHAARNEGDNAIYKAMKDIEWINSYQFDRISELLDASKMSVTVIETENKLHNVIPGQCKFVVDVRINELHTHEEVLGIIKENLQCEAVPRSMRLRSSLISLQHPLVRTGIDLGRNYYGSPTTSDKALMPFPALKIGPGDSARSHIADEFIYLDEIKEGIELYIRLLNKMVL